MSSPPSLSSVGIRISDHIHDGSLYPQLHHDHNNSPSLSDVRSFDKSSYTGNHQIPIPDMYQLPTDKPMSFSALARDQGNSHKNNEVAPGYYNDIGGQPPTIGSIDNRNKNSQPSGSYDGYDLPPSRNHVAPRPTSQTGTTDFDQNLAQQPYGQGSVTGRNIKKIKPPAYYM